MSCRVLKRGMEDAMLDAFVARAAQLGCESIVGCYIPTDRNSMVAEHYSTLGFERLPDTDDGNTRWKLDLTRAYTPRNQHIREATVAGHP